MPDYKQGKIYCLRSHQTDDIYIGSTIQPLYKRLYGHKRNYKQWKNEKYRYVTSYELIKYDDCYIELIEECPCDNNNQLERREGQLIRETDCVNKVVAGRTQKEYREDNIEKIAEINKKYREDNKEQIAKQKKKYQEENKDKIKERNEKYKEDNKKQISEQGKKYYEKNKEHIKEYQKKYSEENKEKIAERNKKYNQEHKNDFKCEVCNFKGGKTGYNKHLKTKKHITSKEADKTNN